MSESSTPTEIAQLATDIIKCDPITDVEMPGDDKVAAVFNRWYMDVLRSCIEGFPWQFAITRANLPLSAVPPAFDYDDAYDLPDDYCSLQFIENDTYPLAKWEYAIERGKILIDYSGAAALPVGYTFLNTDVTMYSAAFKIYLAHALAAYTVAKISGNQQVITRVLNALPLARNEAQSKNGKDAPPRIYRESKLKNARRSYSGTVSELYI